MEIKPPKQVMNPGYTGENRCIPCTVVNLGIGGIISVVVASKFLLLGTLFFAGSVLTIYLRGYLIPGTPGLTKKYLPQRVLRIFGKEPDHTVSDGLAEIDVKSTEFTKNTGTNVDLTPEEVLVEVGVVKSCSDGSDLCLTTEFAQRWIREIRSASRTTPEQLAETYNLPQDKVTITETEAGCVVEYDHGVLGHWPSETAILLEVTASQILQEFHPKWDELSIDQRGILLMSVRLFTPECPQSRTEPSFEKGTVETCCNEFSVLNLTCEETGDVVFVQKLA